MLLRTSVSTTAAKGLSLNVALRRLLEVDLLAGLLLEGGDDLPDCCVGLRFEPLSHHTTRSAAFAPSGATASIAARTAIRPHMSSPRSARILSIFWPRCLATFPPKADLSRSVEFGIVRFGGHDRPIETSPWVRFTGRAVHCKLGRRPLCPAPFQHLHRIVREHMVVMACVGDDPEAPTVPA
jgi:hypothetical protein